MIVDYQCCGKTNYMDFDSQPSISELRKPEISNLNESIEEFTDNKTSFLEIPKVCCKDGSNCLGKLTNQNSNFEKVSNI